MTSISTVTTVALLFSHHAQPCGWTTRPPSLGENQTAPPEKQAFQAADFLVLRGAPARG